MALPILAKFAAAGKKTGKKDLGRMAMTYGSIYVASVAMGANKQQMLKAFLEAEAYPGPSLIICYAPCINQGIQKGLGKTQEEQRLAVASGYWPLYRYNPLLAAEGKNPLVLESKDPDGSLQEFLSGETRYAMLEKAMPEASKAFRKRIEEDYRQRYELLRWMAAPEARFIGGAPAEEGPGLESCAVANGAEHARSGKAEEPCDDGRAGK